MRSGTIIFSDLSPPPVITRMHDQQQTDHRNHADRHADRHPGALGQLFKKAVRLILLLPAETGAGADGPGLRARAGARRSCALNGSGFMLCRTAARRALNVRADDLRLAPELSSLAT